MAKQKYSKGQIKELLNNPNVKNCTPKYITFNDDFKLLALDLDKKWILHRDIFKKCWFPEYIINSNIPAKSLKNWRYKAKHKWIESFQNTKKWRKKKEKINISKMNKDEYIEYLEAKLALTEELKRLDDYNYP